MDQRTVGPAGRTPLVHARRRYVVASLRIHDASGKRRLGSRSLDQARDRLGKSEHICPIVVNLRGNSCAKTTTPRMELDFDVLFDQEAEPQLRGIGVGVASFAGAQILAVVTVDQDGISIDAIKRGATVFPLWLRLSDAVGVARSGKTSSRRTTAVFMSIQTASRTTLHVQRLAATSRSRSVGLGASSRRVIARTISTIPAFAGVSTPTSRPRLTT